MAAGRVPRTDCLEVELRLDARGAICVDDFYQTSIPSIYALGDVIGRAALTPVAINQGIVLAEHLFAKGTRKLSYDLIPTAVFSQPPLASVGLTEAQARAEYSKVTIFETEFATMKSSFGANPQKEFVYMKFVVDELSDRVVGAHILGPDAAEMLQGIAVAMKAGAKKSDFDRTIGIHPTSAEEFVTLRTARLDSLNQDQ
jgi:glutathione reductase (NADPH)